MFDTLLIAHSKQSGNLTIVLHLSVYLFIFTIIMNNIAIAPHMIILH